MKDLASYPISFPYGVTTTPYNPSHPHRGNDRAAPLGTPIIVQGITIGFVGMTGLATGPHCHTQEWQGSKLNVRRPQNEFKPGMVVEVDVNGTTGDKSLGKYVTVRNADGWNTSYCHMNMVNAKVGDNISSGGSMKPTDKQADALIRALVTEANGITPHWPTQSDIDFAISTDWAALMPNYYPGVQRLRDSIKLLTDDRDKNLYPYIEAVTKALGLSSGATKEQCVAAIDKLKAGAVTSVVINGVNYVKQ